MCLFPHLSIGKKYTPCLYLPKVRMCVRAHVQCESADCREALSQAAWWEVVALASHGQQHEGALGDLAPMVPVSTWNVEADVAS